MEKEEYLEDFFIEDEQSFQKGKDLQSLFPSLAHPRWRYLRLI